MAYVLIVDDEPDSSDIIERYLTMQGYKTATVPNGQAALGALVDRQPDALVLDVRMPEMDGISLLEILRSYLRWSHLPVILLTAHANKDEIDQAKALGVEHVFHKSKFKLPQLLDAIKDSLAPGKSHA
jgi:two-component system response regulator AtoC